MVSITLSVSPEVKAEMDKFSEINWSGFIREQIIQKTKQLKLREELMNELDEKSLEEWAVKIIREGRKERLKELKKRNLL